MLVHTKVKSTSLYISRSLHLLILRDPTTEANLQPWWTPYQSYEQVSCIHISARSVYNSRGEKTPAIHLSGPEPPKLEWSG